MSNILKVINYVEDFNKMVEKFNFDIICLWFRTSSILKSIDLSNLPISLKKIYVTKNYYDNETNKHIISLFEKIPFGCKVEILRQRKNFFNTVKYDKEILNCEIETNKNSIKLLRDGSFMYFDTASYVFEHDVDKCFTSRIEILEFLKMLQEEAKLFVNKIKYIGYMEIKLLTPEIEYEAEENIMHIADHKQKKFISCKYMLLEKFVKIDMNKLAEIILNDNFFMLHLV